MCFAPQQRALFRHRSFQKWSEHVVCLTCWLRNVLRATTARTFSTSQLPKAVRAWCVCTFWLGNVLCATTACNFSSLICPAGSAPACFSEPTFRPSGATNHWKNSVSRLCYLFGHLDLLSSEIFPPLIFSLLLFSSLFFCSTSAFNLSILSEVWLLNFLRLSNILGIITFHYRTSY